MIDKSYPGNMDLENDLLNKGYMRICAIDEVGRGCFAGPVVCAAVIMKPGIKIPYLTDSKKIPKKKHNELLDKVMDNCIEYKVSVISNKTIDEINILKATLLGMKQAVLGLMKLPDICLIDGNTKIDIDLPQITVVQGDYFSHAISAASLIAKTYRDKLMTEYDQQYGLVYNWSSNAGYPTKEHIESVKANGLTELHRLSWKKSLEKVMKEKE